MPSYSTLQLYIYTTMSADKLPKELLHKLILKSFEGQLIGLYDANKADDRPGQGIRSILEIPVGHAKIREL
jgi:hypothetical protein